MEDLYEKLWKIIDYEIEKKREEMDSEFVETFYKKHTGSYRVLCEKFVVRYVEKRGLPK